MKAALDLLVKVYKGVMDTHALYMSTTLPQMSNLLENKVQLRSEKHHSSKGNID